MWLGLPYNLLGLFDALRYYVEEQLLAFICNGTVHFTLGCAERWGAVVKITLDAPGQAWDWKRVFYRSSSFPWQHRRLLARPPFSSRK